MKFKYKLTFATLAFSVAFLLIFALVFYYNHRSDIVDSALQNLQVSADRQSHDFEITLVEKVKTVLALSNAPIIKKALVLSNSEFSLLPAANRQKKIYDLNSKWMETKDFIDPFIQTYTKNTLARFLRENQVLFSKEYGEIFITNRYGVIIATTNKLTTLAHSDKYWWIASYNGGKGRIFLDDRGYDLSVEGYVLGVVVPIIQGKKVIGIFKANLNIIDALGHVAEKLKGDTEGIIKLVRSQGLVVFESGEEPLSTKVPKLIVERMRKGEIGSNLLKENGTNTIYAYAPISITLGSEQYGFGGRYKSIDNIKGNKGEGWFIVIAKLLDEVSRPSFYITKWIIITGLALTAIVGFVSLFIGKLVEERTKELHEAQEQLVRREKLAVLGQLAGGVGHELRNPLGAIKTSVYFLNMVLEEPEPDVKVTLDNLNKEVATSERIISSLLDFARPKPPTQRKVDINGLLQETLGSANVPGNIETETRLGDALPPILSDPDQLSQIFGNIILNAIQAMPKGGRLVVKSETPARDWVLLSFSDTGEGIPQEHLEKVFEPLFTTKAKGIGLGMALTKNLVEGHGGTIEVSSEVGKGCTFKVRLPENDRG